MKKYIVLIRTKEMLMNLTKNYDLWREHNKQKMNNMFLAIKFKIRFKVKFCRQYGPI